MNKLIKIGNQKISIKEYNGRRVVTFKDIDMVHERLDGTSRKRFNDNKKHFIEGEDFYKITPSEFRTAIGEMDLRQQNDVTLITESGYLMLVKSLKDDLAWQVQRQLVNSYFRTRQIANEELSPQTQLILQLAQSIANKEIADRERDRQITEVKETANKAIESVKNIREVVKPVIDNWKGEIRKKVVRIQKRTNQSWDMLYGQLYYELEQRAGCNLSTRLKYAQRRMKDEGYRPSAINSLSKMDIVNNDKKLREIFSKIVSEYEIKYCI